MRIVAFARTIRRMQRIVHAAKRRLRKYRMHASAKAALIHRRYVTKCVEKCFGKRAHSSSFAFQESLCSCGTESKPHYCQAKCHSGACPPCALTTRVRCRCGRNEEEVNCSTLALLRQNNGAFAVFFFYKRKRSLQSLFYVGVVAVHGALASNITAISCAASTRYIFARRCAVRCCRAVSTNASISVIRATVNVVYRAVRFTLL